MLELRHDAFAYVFALLLVLRFVPGQRREYSDAAPLGAFVERDEEFVQDRRGDGEDGRIGRGSGRLRRRRRVNIRQRRNGVRDDLFWGEGSIKIKI